jgi:hypothetical protein
VVDDLSSAWTVPDGMNLDLLNTGGAGEQTHVEDPRKDELSPTRSLLCLPSMRWFWVGPRFTCAARLV